MKKLTIVSGATFVLAWVVGLTVAPGGPKPSDSASKIATYFASHEYAAMLQTFLIDAVAGAGLIGISFALRNLLRNRESTSRLLRIAFVAGIAAGAVSFVQAVIGETMVVRAGGSASASSIRTLFQALNDADTVKIALIAVMIGAAATGARRSGALPRWLTTTSLVFGPLLAVSGLAFPLNSDPLYSVLYLTLPLLLIWVVAFTFSVARRDPRESLPEPATAASWPAHGAHAG